MKNITLVNILRFIGTIIFFAQIIFFLSSCKHMDGRNTSYALSEAAAFYRAPSGDTYQPATIVRPQAPMCSYDLNGIYRCY